MEETESFVGVPILYAEAGADDAEDVGRDGDGDGGESENPAAGGGALEEVAIEDGQGEEAHERADAAAGFGDLQLHDRELDDVALKQNRYVEDGKDVAGDAGGEELKRKGDLVEDDRGKRNREDEDEKGEEKLAEHGGAEQCPYDAAQQKDERHARGEELHSIGAEDQEDEGEDDEQNPDPALTNRYGPKRLSLVPQQEQREQRNEGTVRVVRDGPPIINKLDRDPVVDDRQQD